MKKQVVGDEREVIGKCPVCGNNVTLKRRARREKIYCSHKCQRKACARRHYQKKRGPPVGTWVNKDIRNLILSEDSTRVLSKNTCMYLGKIYRYVSITEKERIDLYRRRQTILI